MEENLRRLLMKELGKGEVDLRTYSPLTYAFLGDAVYSLLIRSLTVADGNRPANKLHQDSSKLVCAAAQAAALDAILPFLDEEEQRICRRGHNSNPVHHTRSASMEDYLKATALETLFGYLYLQDRTERIVELLKIGVEAQKGTGKQ